MIEKIEAPAKRWRRKSTQHDIIQRATSFEVALFVFNVTRY